MKFPSNSFYEHFKPTPGAISCCEAAAIFWLAGKVPMGTCMDLGSNAGKAAMSAAAALKYVEFVMVDPIYDLTNREAFKHSVQGVPENMPWSYVNDPFFLEKVKERIFTVSNTFVHATLRGDYSENVIPRYDRYGYVFIDTDDHQEELVMAEVRLLEERMLPGGIIAFHDFENQYAAPKKAAEMLVKTGNFDFVDIPWADIQEYVKSRDLEKGNNSWHMPGVELPCFVGAVIRK